MEVLGDERGWGRMSGVVVRGVEGRRLLLLDVHWPVRSGDELVGAMWNRQSQEMIRLGLVKGGGVPDPRKQLLADMRQLMLRWGSERDVGIVMMGDMNLPVMRGACGSKQRRSEYDEWMEVLSLGGLVNLSKDVWGGKGGMWSYESGDRRSWIDWVCVSKSVVAAGGVTGLWMIDKAVTCSDHRSMMIDLDHEVVLGVPKEVGEAAQWKQRGVRLLDGHDPADVKMYGRLLGEEVDKMEGEGMEGMVKEMEELSGEWLRGGDEAKAQRLRGVMEMAFQAYAKVMKETEEGMVNQLISPVRRHGWSREMVGNAKALRAVRRIQRWARCRRSARLVQRVEEGVKMVRGWSGAQLEVPPDLQRCSHAGTSPRLSRLPISN